MFSSYTILAHEDIISQLLSGINTRKADTLAITLGVQALDDISSGCLRLGHKLSLTMRAGDFHFPFVLWRLQLFLAVGTRLYAKVDRSENASTV